MPHLFLSVVLLWKRYLLQYEITTAALENRSLYVSLWHNSLFGKNVFLGEVNIPLNYKQVDSPPKTYQLRPKVRA